MNTEAQTQNIDNGVKPSKRIVAGEGVVGYAVLGCIVAGTIGIYKAAWANGVDAAACLVASVVAFGTICYIYFRKE